MWRLPDGVVETILLGLPAFDLLRCRGVCKLWRSLISSPNFVAEHLDRSKSDPSSYHLLVRDHLSNIIQHPAGPFSSLICFSSVNLIIVGSVNGLICVAEKCLIVPWTHEIWILNPVTGLSIHLPYSKFVLTSDDQNIKLAFWCDDDGVYRVAKFVSDPDGETVRELWVSTDPYSWSVISPFKIDFQFEHRLFHACDVLIEGLAAYWIVIYCDDDDDDRDGEINVVSLDFKSLAMTTLVPLSNRQLDMPKGYLRNANCGLPNSVLFGGNLNGEFVLVAHKCSADTEYYYDVWTMGMDDTRAPRGWIKKFSICLDSFPFDDPLGIVNDKLLLISYEEKVIALYDPLTGTWEVVEIDANLETSRTDSACRFVGSLVSIDGFGIENNERLHQNLCITWPYSLHPSVGPKDGWCRRDWKKQEVDGSDFL